MTLSRSFSRPFLWLCACLLFTAGAVAQDLGALRSRMQERLPQLDALKAQGVIGETNDGYVAVRADGNPQAPALVAAENADRKAVYAAIAQRTGAAADAVARARARQIAAASAQGVWLQDEGGRWYRKS